MKNPEEFILDILNKKFKKNQTAIGYPTNRENSFKINQNLINKYRESTYFNTLFINDDHENIEPLIIKMLSKHFNYSYDNIFGYITSGGTEANFSPIWWHRKFLQKRYNQLPVLLSCEESHYSVEKMAEQLGIKNIQIKSKNKVIDLDDLELKLKAINEPIIVCANLGYTTFGGIDSLIEIYELLNKYAKNKFKIHIDGAIYGLLFPYMDQFKSVSTIFDIADSLSFSSHKFLGTYNVAGIVLCKKDYIENIFYTKNHSDIYYLKNKNKMHDFTFSGSRDAFFEVEIYLLLIEAFKTEGKHTKLELLWNKCLNKALWLANEINKILVECLDNKINKELFCYLPNQLSIIFPLPNNAKVQKFMYEKYELMTVSENQFGLYVFPGNLKKFDIFLNDYKNILK